jgi:NTP pyrophosphatase (non-canonical NTP hydrolase)
MVNHQLQDRIVAWHEDRFPEKTIWHVLAKLTEEVGELNQAITGAEDRRLGRGDPIQEVAQAALVLFTVAGRYLQVDLLAQVSAEIYRIEALGMPWEAEVVR